MGEGVYIHERCWWEVGGVVCAELVIHWTSIGKEREVLVYKHLPRQKVQSMRKNTATSKSGVKTEACPRRFG